MSTRGRPPNTPIDALRVKLWFYGISDEINTFSAYQIEKHFDGDKFLYNREDGTTMRPCKFDKYKSGKHIPNSGLVDRVEDQAPNTRYLLFLPLWELLSNPHSDSFKIYSILAKLDKNVSRLLFYRETIDSAHPVRLNTKHYELIDKLDRLSNIDSLTACLGMILECRLTGNVLFELEYAKCAFRLLSRVLVRTPYHFIWRELYCEIRDNFLTIDNTIDFDLFDRWNAYIADFPFDELLELQLMMILLVEDLGVINHYFPDAPERLYYSDKYLSIQTLVTIRDLNFNREWDKIECLPEFKKLKRALRLWEKRKLKEKTIH